METTYLVMFFQCHLLANRELVSNTGHSFVNMYSPSSKSLGNTALEVNTTAVGTLV